MAPEQARGEVEELDVRADIYSLGAILYHILALRPPVIGRTAMEIVDKVGRGEVEPLVGTPRRGVQPSSRLQVCGSSLNRVRTASEPTVNRLGTYGKPPLNRRLTANELPARIASQKPRRSEHL